MNRILAKLWLWLWFLLPANPILVRVVAGASRRSRHLMLRTVYLTALLLVVVFSLFLAMSGQNASLADLAKHASQTFAKASVAQLALMCFLAPVFTASAITQERDAQTFNILLSTPLTSAQIVFGSLMSRLYFVLMLLVAGLPIFLMTMVYGGVTAPQVFESFALSGATAVLTGSLAIFVAMIGVGTRRTIFSFYLLIVIYLLCLYLLGRWDRTWIDASAPNIDGRQMSWLTPLHPFLALEVALHQVYAPPYSQLSEMSSLGRYAVAYPSATYIMWTLGLALILTTASIMFVRRGAKTGESTFVSNLLDRFRRHKSGDRTRPPRNVWQNPVAWREAKTRASGSSLIRMAIVVVGFVGPSILFFDYVGGDLSNQSAGEWLAGLIMTQFALVIIIATNTAATSITKEKESKTMELLLTTPLTSKYILWGKLRGLVSFASPLLIGPLVVLLVFGLYGVLGNGAKKVVDVEAAIVIGMLLVTYTAFACVVGVWRSLNSKTNVAAVMYSIAIVVLMCGVASMIGFAIVGNSGGEVGAFFAPFTPFTAVWYLVCSNELFTSPSDFAKGAAGARTAALFGSVIAVAVYAVLVWQLYTGLIRSFDMTLRKQSSG